MENNRTNQNPENAENATPIVAPKAEKVNSLTQLMRDYEKAHATNGDHDAKALYPLATAIAFSVAHKLADPQAKTAQTRENVSTTGCNPVMQQLRRDIAHDVALLDNTRRNTNAATKLVYNPDGDSVSMVVDNDADRAAKKLITDTLTDGIDLVQAAAIAILEQAADHADSGAEWLEKPYTVRRLSKRVYIRADDSAAYRDIETSPIREIYRAVRACVANSRAAQTDPRNGYVYIDDLSEDGLETIYRRAGKYSGLAGYAATEHSATPGAPSGYGNSNHFCTTDAETVNRADALIAALNLSARQAQIVALRLQGKGQRAIATYLGVTPQAVQNTLAKIQRKADAIGLTPAK